MIDKYQLHENIILRESDGKALILATGNVVELNETGLFVLQLLKQPETIKGIMCGIDNEWKLDETTSLKDIQDWLEEFIASAVQEGLIVLVSE